jgi:serine/threonine-protein kinase
MGDESNFLDKLAESIADGGPIDWAGADEAADDDLRRLLKHLRVLADLAEVHRSLADDVAVTPTANSIATGTTTVEPSQSGLGRWGHLLLIRKIGEGAFGEVYHAHDTWLDHPVALKLFKRNVADHAQSDRLLHEARKLARVRHPNIVSVHGADSHNGQIGFWMDLVEGQTLEDLVLAGRQSATEATVIGQEVCRALAAVHRAQIIHRDVKAQNVMRASDDGRIILMDFGAGEFISDSSALSRRQGTPLYLSPEVLAGESATVQCDIYAVGVLLYYLVTGDFPVRAPSIPALIEAHKRGERTHLRDGRPDLPNAFVSVVEQALEPDPARRFVSAGEMDGALTAFLAPKITQADGRSRFQVALQRTALTAVISAAALAWAGSVGLVASRFFEVGLGIEREFAAGPAQYFSVGTAALTPFVIFWLVLAILAVVIIAGLRSIVPQRFAAAVKGWTAGLASADAEKVATIVFLAGAAAALAITVDSWSIFHTMDALRIGPNTKPVDLSALSSASRPLHRFYSNSSVLLSFLLGFAAWQWFPRLESRAGDDAKRAVRRFRWATLVVAIIVVSMASMPRRFIWERFEVVQFENQPAFVIGSNSDELLLYSPRGGERRRWRVRKDATTLQRTGTTAYLFDSE